MIDTTLDYDRRYEKVLAKMQHQNAWPQSMSKMRASELAKLALHISLTALTITFFWENLSYT